MRHTKLIVFLAILVVGSFVLLQATKHNDSVRGQDPNVETRGTNTDGLPPAVGTAGGAAASPAEAGMWRGDATFAAEAAQMNANESALADLARRRGASAEVKRYAAELHRDHAAAGEELGALAGRRAWSLPASMDPLQKQALQALDQSQGPEFDQAFVDAMIASHERALASFRSAATSAEDHELRAFAARHVTTLQNHLDHARTLKNR